MSDTNRIPKNDRWEVWVNVGYDGRPHTGAWTLIAEIRSSGLPALLLPRFEQIYPAPQYVLKIIKAGSPDPNSSLTV